MKSKNKIGYIAGIVMLLLLGVCLSAFIYIRAGNPISYFLAKKEAEAFINEEYAEKGYQLSDFGFDFVGPYYYATFENAEHPDTNFFIHLNSFGKVTFKPDERITKAHERAMALERKYNERFRSITDSESFPIENLEGSVILDIAYSMENDVSDYLEVDTLPANYEYDLEKIAAEKGCLYVEIDADTIGLSRCAEYLKVLKDILFEEGCPYRETTLIMKKKGESFSDESMIVLLAVPADIIDSDNLEEKLPQYLEDKEEKYEK